MILGKILQRWIECLCMNVTGVCTLTASDGWMLLGLPFLIFVVVCVERKLITVLLTLRAIALAPAVSRRQPAVTGIVILVPFDCSPSAKTELALLTMET